MKHTLIEIVRSSYAQLKYICNGKVYYNIDIDGTIYQLELNSMDADWKDQYIELEYKSITLMRWIREGIDNNDGTFIQLTP